MARKQLPNQVKSAVRARQAIVQATDFSDVDSEIAGLDTRLDAVEAWTTTDVPEGSNLYYTATRVNAAIDARVTESYVEALGIEVPWTDITGKPSTFTPSAHTHVMTDVTDITAAGRALLDDANAAAQRTTLGLGTAAVVNTGTSGASIPLLNGSNTWSATQTISGGDLYITRPASTDRQLIYTSGGTLRWSAATTSATESGSNTGSDFALARFNDAGTFVDIPFTINRASGVATFSTTPTVAGSAIWHTSNDSNLAKLTGTQTFTGSKLFTGGFEARGDNKLANAANGAHSWIPYSDGRVYLSGSEVVLRTDTYAPIATLGNGYMTMRHDVNAGVGPIIQLSNQGGGAGTGSSINFIGAGSQNIASRIYSSDDGNWAHNLILSTKTTGASGNALVERMRIRSDGVVEVYGTSPNIASSVPTHRGSFVINETGITSLAQRGGLEFKGSVFGSGYGSKIVGFDDSTLVFANRANSATWTENLRITSAGLVSAPNGYQSVPLDTNMNTHGKHSGFYRAAPSVTGAPTTDWQNVLRVKGESWAYPNEYLFELSHPFFNDEMYVRRITNGGFGTWRPVAHMMGSGAVSGKITWGTAAPGTLAVGEIYLRHS